MVEPLVTVILPCYNAENYIADALNSILNQSYNNLEVIVIDDGSTDNSIEVVAQQIKTDRRTRLVTNETNLGLIQTLNKGVNLAKGKYIARMDADDVSHKERIKSQVDFLTKHPKVDILGTKATPIGVDGKILTRDSITYTSETTLKFSVLFTQPFFHGSILSKTSVLKENLYSEDFKHSEDFELWNRLSYKKYTLSNLNQVLYFYRINPNGVSTMFETIQIESHNLASKEYIEKFLGESVDLNLVSILNNRPNNIVTINHVNKALVIFSELDKKLNITKKEVELQHYISRQKINILLQCIKKSKSFAVKFFCVGKLIVGLTSTEALTYFLKKF